MGVCFDHCHRTGKFRGWICAKCNSALGLTGDSPSLLRELANYLEEFERDKANFQGAKGATEIGIRSAWEPWLPYAGSLSCF